MRHKTLHEYLQDYYSKQHYAKNSLAVVDVSNYSSKLPVDFIVVHKITNKIFDIVGVRTTTTTGDNQHDNCAAENTANDFMKGIRTVNILEKPQRSSASNSSKNDDHITSYTRNETATLFGTSFGELLPEKWHEIPKQHQ